MMAGCNESDPSIKHTNTEAFAGEWFVTYTLDGSDVGGGYTEIITSNTAANVATEMFVSDWVDPTAKSGNFWTYKVKAQSDPKGLTFSADQSESSVEGYNIKVNILNGKIFPKGGLSKSKVVVDSIYFEIEFEDDSPAFGNKYVVSGHKRTGFTEDEY